MQVQQTTKLQRADLKYQKYSYFKAYLHIFPNTFLVQRWPVTESITYKTNKKFKQ